MAIPSPRTAGLGPGVRFVEEDGGARGAYLNAAGGVMLPITSLLAWTTQHMRGENNLGADALCS